MTIIVAGTIDIPANVRTEAVTGAADLMVATRAQKGCNHYVWSLDPTSDTRVYVYESWQSTEALADHLLGQFYSKMLEHLGGFGISNVEVAKFQISREQAVYDAQGVARADFFDE